MMNLLQSISVYKVCYFRMLKYILNKTGKTRAFIRKRNFDKVEKSCLFKIQISHVFLYERPYFINLLLHADLFMTRLPC